MDGARELTILCRFSFRGALAKTFGRRDAGNATTATVKSEFNFISATISRYQHTQQSPAIPGDARLPVELWLKIFEHLPKHGTLSLTCRGFHDILLSSRFSTITLLGSSSHRRLQSLPANIIPSVRHVLLSHYSSIRLKAEEMDDFFASLESFLATAPNLTKFTARDSCLSPSLLNSLKGSDKLRFISLSDVVILGRSAESSNSRPATCRLTSLECPVDLLADFIYPDSPTSQSLVKYTIRNPQEIAILSTVTTFPSLTQLHLLQDIPHIVALQRFLLAISSLNVLKIWVPPSPDFFNPGYTHYTHVGEALRGCHLSAPSFLSNLTILECFGSEAQTLLGGRSLRSVRLWQVHAHQILALMEINERPGLENLALETVGGGYEAFITLLRDMPPWLHSIVEIDLRAEHRNEPYHDTVSGKTSRHYSTNATVSDHSYFQRFWTLCYSILLRTFALWSSIKQSRPD